MDIDWPLPPSNYKLPHDLPYEQRMLSISLRAQFWYRRLAKQ